MNRIVVLVCSLLLLACSKGSGEQFEQNSMVELDIALTTEGRVAFDNYRYSWEGGEQLGLFVESQTPTHNALATVEVRDGQGYCTSVVECADVGDTLYGYTPYSANNSDAQAVRLVVPSEQNVARAGEFPQNAMPMVAEPYIITAENDQGLLFQPLGGILCFNIYATSKYQSERVVSVRYATSKPISGEFDYDITQAEPKKIAVGGYSVESSLDSYYTLPATKDGATPIYMVVAPGNHSGTLRITTDVAIYTYNYQRSVERNNYYKVNIDLSNAKYRKSLTATEPVKATLTYDECKSVINGYGNANSYTNSYGRWTICAYNHENIAIQLNGGKVAYVGTPTFSGAVQSLTLTLTESYSNKLYICSEAGTSSAAGVVKSVNVSGNSVTVDLKDHNLKQFYIRSEKCMRICKIEIIYGDSGGEILPDPTPEPMPDPTPEPQPIPSDAKILPYTESFAAGEGDFVIENVQLGELTYVWKHSTYNGKSYMKASAFMNDKAYAAESWLISPPISLVDVTSPKLSFEHTHKFAADPTKEFTLWIAEYDSQSWTKLTIPTYGTNTDWTFVKSGDIALDDYIGKVVKVAFKYISTTSKSGTWEVCNFSVTGTVNGGGTTPTPDPDPTPDPTPSTARYNWAELPVITDANNDGVHDNDSNLYYAHHICAGGEKNAQRNGTARNYTVCYSGKHHCPLWVAAPRHKSYESGASRTDAYGKDPKIPSDVQYNSKSTGGGCNKGHMLGSAERLSSTATNKQVFYYTNIAPQYSDTFNTGGGAWNNLEDHIDGLVCSDTLYVVVGCYFENFSKNGASASPKTISFGGRSDVSCPTMFYYALLRTKKGSTGKRVQDCSASELQCAAFTICHEMEKGHKPQAADMMSISELEKLTGFSYFTNVPNAPKTTFSSSDWL